MTWREGRGTEDQEAGGTDIENKLMVTKGEM